MNPLFASAVVVSAIAASAGHGEARAQMQSQSAGNWLFSAGLNNIDPRVDSGNLTASSLPGTKIDVKDATSPIVVIAYMLTDNVSIETFLGYPYEHDIVGAGAIAGVGKLGSVKQVSPTVLGQYRFGDAAARFRPYAGLGLTYAYFFKEEGSGTLTGLTNPGGSPTRMKVQNAWGVSTQIGATWAVDERWFLNGSVMKTFIKNTTNLSTGQSIDVHLDPLIINASVGYRF